MGKIICLLGGMAMLAVVGLGCEDGEVSLDYNNKNEVFACGVNDQLQNIEWLREFCEDFNETQDVSKISIELYKVIDTDEHVFKIGISYSEFDDSPFAYSENWRNCIGEIIFALNSGVPPNPELVENFMKDKKFITELFHFIKQ